MIEHHRIATAFVDELPPDIVLTVEQRQTIKKLFARGYLAGYFAGRRERKREQRKAS